MVHVKRLLVIPNQSYEHFSKDKVNVNDLYICLYSQIQWLVCAPKNTS